MSNYAIIADKVFTGKKWMKKCIILIESEVIADIIELPNS